MVRRLHVGTAARLRDTEYEYKDRIEYGRFAGTREKGSIIGRSQRRVGAVGETKNRPPGLDVAILRRNV